MMEHDCVTKTGEYFVIKQNDEGIFLCPVCGSAELAIAPYNENGEASFEICSCGFEFGFDDSHLASDEAVEGVKLNWDRWRLKVIEKNTNSKSNFEKMERNLAQIGYKLAFDLIPVRIHENT